MDFIGPTPRTLDRTHDLLFFGWYCQLLDLHVYYRLVSRLPVKCRRKADK
jgi:hypothetical protein